VASASFGYAVAGAGDLNGDGYGDIAVGAPNGNNGSGGAYVYLGSSAGLTTTAVSPAPKLPNGNFGYALGAAGDVNGDGYADLVVGLYTDDVACVYQGSATQVIPNGTFAQPSAVLSVAGSGINASDFGNTVAGAGDVDGDGYADVVVGASANNAAYVYRGAAAGLSTTFSTTIVAPGTQSFPGSLSVAGAGDVNGDGFGDVFVSSFIVNTSNGEVDLHGGSAAGVAIAPTSVFVGVNGEEFGVSTY
jgi:hypothetical protein